MGRLPGEAWLGLLAVVAATGLVVASNALVPEPPRRMALPTAGELLELERYLEPVAAAVGSTADVPPRVEIGGSPFGRAPTARAETVPGSGRQPDVQRPRWRVTAIMITGTRRVAVVNDGLVRPGETLSDGARIAAIERDHVVLITPDGQRRRLELER